MRFLQQVGIVNDRPTAHGYMSSKWTHQVRAILGTLICTAQINGMSKYLLCNLLFNTATQINVKLHNQFSGEGRIKQKHGEKY